MLIAQRNETPSQQAQLGQRAQQKIASRWIPQGSTKVTHPLGICYTQDTPRGFAVIAYAGNAGKRSFYELHRRAEDRDRRISEFFRDLEGHQLLKAQRNAERARPHVLKAGDILHHSWGWEQTNCDYYQVVGTTTHTVTVRGISDKTVEGSTYSHGMADMRLAVPDSFHGEEITLRANAAGISNKSDGPLSHGCISKWDGKPNYCSWYA
jgi:hypothetical protein